MGRGREQAAICQARESCTQLYFSSPKYFQNSSKYFKIIVQKYHLWPIRILCLMISCHLLFLTRTAQKEQWVLFSWKDKSLNEAFAVLEEPSRSYFSSAVAAFYQDALRGQKIGHTYGSTDYFLYIPLHMWRFILNYADLHRLCLGGKKVKFPTLGPWFLSFLDQDWTNYWGNSLVLTIQSCQNRSKMNLNWWSFIVFQHSVSSIAFSSFFTCVKL